MFDVLKNLMSGNKNVGHDKDHKIRVLFWNTTFQADNLTLARYLDSHPDFIIAVALPDKDAVLNEPIHKLMPLKCKMFEQNSRDVFAEIKKFHPVVTIVDNHFPPKKLSPYLFVLWHGFGWKGPNDKAEFAQVHKSVKKLTGFSSFQPNPKFRWQCFGKTDLEHRNIVSGFAIENLLNLGPAFSDDLVKPLFEKKEILKFYPENFKNHKIALIACTWHYGRIFSHWGDDIEIFDTISSFLKEKNYCIILRLHDKNRYEQSYLKLLEEFSSKHDNVLLKFKNVERDNLLDICVSDIMISNFSSILNYYYYTMKPSIHIYPVKSENESFLWRVMKNGKVHTSEVTSAEFIWKLPPEENGGITVRSVEELKSAILKADNDPDCCAEKSSEFIKKHMAPFDGKTCERIAASIVALVS